MNQYKKPSDEELKKNLTAEQYRITQQCGTEPPFQNKYWDNHRAGIYVDVVTGEPLFSSLDKFDSGSGWPSFTQPLTEVQTKEDRSHFMKRTEVLSKSGGSHLGHVFDDGPGPTQARYCINSAALKFIPVEELESQGYGEFRKLFKPEQVAVLAGGCFWGVEDLIRALPGVVKTEVGYTGGSTADPTYETVKTGRTGHAEAIRITFDPGRLSYEDLLLYYFRIHDPTTLNQQGNDRGSQYRSAIFYADEEQKSVAKKIKSRVDQSGAWKKASVTEIVPAAKFYSAEEYHQAYLQKNPGGYTCHFERDVKF